MKIVLFLADMLGIGRRIARGSRVIFFSAWPKDKRVRYWATDIDKVMITCEPKYEHRWYSIRVFTKHGDKVNYTVSESTFLDLQNSSLQFVRSPKLGVEEATRTA